MRKKIIAGNWKMNGQQDTIISLLHNICELLPPVLNSECIVFPPSIYLAIVQSKLKNTRLSWGAQNLYPSLSGAFTGEISSSMLQDYGCRYVLIGHSERRTLFKEDEKFITDKFHHVKEHGMIPILCVGETQQERHEGRTKEVLIRQLESVAKYKFHAFHNAIIAYEPVWAIGTGQSALPEDAQAVHLMIRELITELSDIDASTVSILYGGSVNEKNAQALFAMPDVDGGLIGGASLNARQFVEIVKCIN